MSDASAATTSADTVNQLGIIRPDSSVKGIPCFDIDDSAEFHSFCRGIKRFHLWKQHTKSETIRGWAKQNPGKDFYVQHQGHYTLVRRSKK